MEATTTRMMFVDEPVVCPASGGAEVRWRWRAKRCAFALIPLLALLAVAELVARCCVSETTIAKRFEQIEQIIVFLGNEPEESIFEPDPRCFWRMKPNIVLPPERGTTWGGVMSNSHRLRSREVSVEETRDRLRVLCFGDSSTFGFGVDLADAWPNQLQELLDSEHPAAVEVLNAGIPGHTTYQGRQRLAADLAKWQPHLAIITFGNNDGWRWDGLADKDHAQLNGSAVSSWLDHSRAWRCLLSVRLQANQRQAVENESRWAEQATGNYFTPNTNWTPRVSLPDFSDNLHAMIDVCRRNGCELALIVWPDQRQLLDQPTWRLPYQEAMRQVAQEADVPCVDLVPLFEQAGRWAVKRFLPQDVIHVDRAGNQSVSNAVAPHVRQALRTSRTNRN
jgi:lysophospholipase L1-like esterase